MLSFVKAFCAWNANREKGDIEQVLRCGVVVVGQQSHCRGFTLAVLRTEGRVPRDITPQRVKVSSLRLMLTQGITFRCHVPYLLISKLGLCDCCNC